MRHPDYPGASSFTDRHGKERWRLRGPGMKPVMLPGEPGEHLFDCHYQAAIEGRPIEKPRTIPLKKLVVLAPPVKESPRATQPVEESLDACWLKAKQRPDFLELDQTTRKQYSRMIETFLDARASNRDRRGAGPVARLDASAIQDALDGMSSQNGRILKLMLKRLFHEAALQGLIKYSPLSLTRAKKQKKTRRALWTPDICAKFEARWPYGTAARTAYELGRWMGIRRSDIALLRWDMLTTKIDETTGKAVEGFQFVEFKGRRRDRAYAKFHPITPMLAVALAPLDRSTPTVLVNRFGKPFRMASLTARMWDEWCPKAGIAKTYTLHGLRKAVGAMLSDADASLHASRDFLGHATYKEVEIYNRGRDQARSAIAAARDLTEFAMPKRPSLKVVDKPGGGG